MKSEYCLQRGGQQWGEGESRKAQGLGRSVSSCCCFLMALGLSFGMPDLLMFAEA